MSIGTYGELKASIASWLNRTNLTSQIPDFITLGEQRIYYGSDLPFQSQALRVPAMQDRASGNSGTIAFPTGYLETIVLNIADGQGINWDAEYVTPAQYSKKQNDAGPPSFYTIRDNAIQTPGTSMSYTLDFYKKFDALSDDADTNWLLTNAPGVYLYAALVEANPYLMDEARTAAWLGMLKSSIGSLNTCANHQGGSLSVRAG